MGKNVNVEAWVAMFREIGLGNEEMETWHRLFESRYPESHQSFLQWLGFSNQEIAEIRQKYQ